MGSQLGALHVKPAAQSAGSTQLVLQALLPSQAKGVHCELCWVHWLGASQVKIVSIDAAQVAGMQVAPTG